MRCGTPVMYGCTLIAITRALFSPSAYSRSKQSMPRRSHSSEGWFCSTIIAMSFISTV